LVGRVDHRAACGTDASDTGTACRARHAAGDEERPHRFAPPNLPVTCTVVAFSQVSGRLTATALLGIVVVVRLASAPLKAPMPGRSGVPALIRQRPVSLIRPVRRVPGPGPTPTVRKFRRRPVALSRACQA